jgi:hypothetical protein
MAGGVTTFTLVACDWTTALAQIDTFASATIIPRHNAVSTYQLSMPADTDAARVLVAALRPRVLVLDPAGAVYRSGPVVRFERTSSRDDGETLTVYGVDDLVWLRRRLVHPQPGSAAPPYSTTAYDSRTGSASQVLAGYVDRNAGAAATPLRQVPGLTAPVPAAFGPTITLSGRWQNLLDFLAQAADAAGLGIRVRDLAFEVYQPAGSAVFSVDLGTLAGWESVEDAPDTNYVYVGGSGEGTARVIREYAGASVQAWGRLESFSDRRDTAAAADMDQTGAEALADGDRPITVDFEALDTLSQSFLRDWNVGDLATVNLAGVTLRDVISAATINLEPNAPATVTPTLGAGAVTLEQWRQLTLADRRIRQLERT